MLGLVDDTIGVTEAGYKAQQMNAFFNIKTAEKGLQFGPSKCKTILVGKATEKVLNSELTVDSWKVTVEDNLETGETDFLETYEGQISIGKTDKTKYLGFTISNRGDNLVNITELKNKSIGVIRSIFNRLESLHLKKYYFECGMLFMNIMLRPSILYACETYYNLKESEIRQIERIEEGYMRRLLKTTKGCPINQLYFELGQIPARFEILKLRLLFLKYILDQEEESLINKFFKLQIQQPTKGDWGSTCISNLSELNMNLSLEEIKSMPKQRFKNILKQKILREAFEYLVRKKKGTKGKEIEYEELKMADYLLPNNIILSIENQRNIFAIRNMMVNIPANFSSQQKATGVVKCICGQIENMKHIYSCNYLNSDSELHEYGKIFFGTLTEQKEIFERFQINLEKRYELSINKSEKEKRKQTH